MLTESEIEQILDEINFTIQYTERNKEYKNKQAQIFDNRKIACLKQKRILLEQILEK